MVQEPDYDIEIKLEFYFIAFPTFHIVRNIMENKYKANINIGLLHPYDKVY